MHDSRFAQHFHTIQYDVTVMRSLSREAGQVSFSVESDADQHLLVLTFHHPCPSTRFTAISNRIGNDATSPGVKEFGILDDMGLPKSLFDMNSAANHTTMGSFAFESCPTRVQCRPIAHLGLIHKGSLILHSLHRHTSFCTCRSWQLDLAKWTDACT